MIFADSGYFIALWNPGDPWHDRAVRIEQLLREGGWAKDLDDLMTILPMAWEAGDGLSRGVSCHRGLECYREIVNNCRVVVPDRPLVLKAFEGTYRVYADVKRKKPGMIDSIAVAAMRRDKIPRLVSFDQGFDLVPDIRRVRLTESPDGFALGF
jgi:predicted nucleic acid-binding protein